MYHPTRLPRSRYLALSALAALLVGGPACDDDRPSVSQGGVIEGRVFYEGQTYPALSRPALQVAAFGTFPPGGPPHAARVIENPVFGDDGVPYRLSGLPVYDKFFVVGQIIDLDDPANTTAPAGSYPDFCQLSEPTGTVAVTEDAPTTGIDFTLYGSGGAEDPCAVVTDACPEAGRGSLVIEARANVAAGDIGASDTAVIALFTSFPGAPALFRVVPSADLEFPLTVILPNVVPNDYVVYVCYDRGGDNSQGLCDETEDTFAFYDMQNKVSFAEATIVQLGLDLETGDSNPAKVTTAAEAGCE
jgi:hypothetical protein